MAARIGQDGEGRGRALVTIGADERLRPGRPMAVFLAQVIACERRLPDYRRARRIEPAIAAALYGGRPSPDRGSFDGDA